MKFILEGGGGWLAANCFPSRSVHCYKGNILQFENYWGEASPPFDSDGPVNKEHLKIRLNRFIEMGEGNNIWKFGCWDTIYLQICHCDTEYDNDVQRVEPAISYQR